MLPLLYSLTSVLVISLFSIVLIYWLISHIPHFMNLITPLISIAVGCLLGDAFLHLLPESVENISSPNLVGLLTILGIIAFFAIEKFVRWHHCHDPDCQETNNAVVPVSLVGESFHNFIDGVVIAGSFMVSRELGLATSLAVLLHEIPQEVGDFSIYTHHGLSLTRSLYLNLISASTSLLGVIVTIFLGGSIQNLSYYILPLTAGGFIYLAASDLIPELHSHHHQQPSSALVQILCLFLGVAIMYSLLLLE